MGQAMHHVIERASGECEDGELSEHRYFVEVDGKKISGQVDFLKRKDGTATIFDVKNTTTRKIMKGDTEDWEKQLNLYAQLARLNGEKIDGLEIIVILRDWKKGESWQKDYPAERIIKVPIKLWDETMAQKYLEERVAIHSAAASLSDDDLPECTEAERWSYPKYVAMREGNERASKVFNSMSEGLAWKAELPEEIRDEYSIDKRPGNSIRCRLPCPAAEYCSQWKREKSMAQSVIVVNTQKEI